MRRGIVIGLVLLGILTAVGIGVGAYNLGVSEGISREVVRTGGDGDFVRGYGRGWGYGPGFGFFPFGLILFPLLVLAFFALARGFLWRGRWGGPGYGPRGYGGPGPWGQGGSGPWGPGAGGPSGYEEWHRRQHEQGGAPLSSGQAGEPRSAGQSGEQPDARQAGEQGGARQGPAGS
jgi:hypothetical protein